MIVRGEGGFRIEIDVDTTTVVEGKWEDDANDAIVSFRKKVEEMVYGKREEYMGPNESIVDGCWHVGMSFEYLQTLKCCLCDDMLHLLMPNSTVYEGRNP